MKKKFTILPIVCTCIITFPLCSCGENKEDEHKHDYVVHRDEDEHYFKCECGDIINQGSHEDGLCKDCADVRVLAFGFNEGGDTAHSDFCRDANKYFSEHAKENNYIYNYVGDDYSYINDDYLKDYDEILFLNNRPWGKNEQDAFQRFIESGGAWMGFHAAAFSMRNTSLDREEDPSYWYWYQDEFLKCGDYAKNTWNPTSEWLTIENWDHPALDTLQDDDKFKSTPCEWYGWEYDLFDQDDIDVILTLNPTRADPAGDQPDKNKAYEIWYDGNYPIAWSNTKYNMLYMNWGHNLQSYNNGKEGTKSSTFSSEKQTEFMMNALLGMGKKAKKLRANN